MLGSVAQLVVGALMTMAASASAPANHAVVRLVAGPIAADSSHARWLGLEFHLVPGWHVYWRNPGDAGSPPAVTWTLPAGWSLGEIEFPRPTRIDVPPLAAFGYENRVVFPIRLRVGAQSDAAVIRGHVSWVACKLECVAEEDSVTFRFDPAAVAKTQDARLVADAVTQLPRSAPSDWSTAAESIGPNIVLTIRGTFGDETRAAEFFPGDPGVIEHAALVGVKIDANRLTLTLARSRYALAPPTKIGGLIVVHGQDDAAQSYTVDVPLSPPTVARAETSSWQMLLLLALVSGLLVNVMPCVFPLLGVKAMSLSSSSVRSIDRRMRGIAYGAGSIASSVAIGGALLVASGPTRSAWGFQMQSPGFLGAVALLTFGAALSLVGVFDVPALWPSWLATRTDKLTATAGSFVAGSAAILIGAPCAAPFFGVALAGAFTAPLPLGIATFACFGLGAASPFVLLALIPRAADRLPRSGRWMETAKQLLAFPLFAATAWLIWVAQLQTGALGSATLLASLCAMAFGAWILGRWRTVQSSTAVRRATLVGFAVIVAASLTAVARLQPTPPVVSGVTTSGLQWQTYSDARRDSLLVAGRPVLVDFTAAWCLTCKVNELGTLQSDRVVAALSSRSVGLLRADLTVADTAVTRALQSIGRASVPTYALYSPNVPAVPRILPTLLTPAAVVEAVERP